MSMFPQNGDGWFESNIGCSASDLVYRLRKARRHNNEEKDFIDKAIQDIRTMKSMEMDATLKMHPWTEKHSDTIRELGMSDKTMKSLRRFKKNRFDKSVYAVGASR